MFCLSLSNLIQLKVNNLSRKFTSMLSKLPSQPDEMYDAKDEADLQKWKDSRHPWTSPGTAPVFGNGCGANGGNPYGCDCQENGSNDCYGDDTRAYGSCCAKVGWT